MTTAVPETATRRRTERLAGVAVALAGVVLLVATLMIPEPARQSPGLGPRMLPGMVSVGLLVCGVVLALTASRRTDEGIEDTLLDDQAEEELHLLAEADDAPVPLRSFGVVLALLVGYAVLFIPLGFVLSTTLFLGGVTTYVDPRRWLRNWVFAAVLSGGVYLLFTRVLLVVLPSGVLG